MFTGLIQGIGVVRDIDMSRGDARVEIEVPLDASAVQLGASICCSGCCLTVVEKSNTSLFFDVSAETISKTTIGAWRVMTRVNIEPSLKIGDEIGGHFVSGHVDSKTTLLEKTKEGDSWRLEIEIPQGMEKYIAPKGSVVIDGISLTINEVNDTSFGVNIVPHTWEHTTLSDLDVGDEMNLEVDMLARYVANMIEKAG